MNGRKRRRGQLGQAMVIMVGGVVATIGLLALVIDGGNLWSQQRIVQNGADAAAEAGAIVLAQRLAGSAIPVVGWDAQVQAKVLASAATNGIDVSGAYYTDICGIPLKPDGTAALSADGTYDFSSADQVGSGSLPGGSATTPNCPSLTVGPVAGVLVLGHRNVGTYLANVVGLRTVDIGTKATAVSGWLSGICDSSSSSSCALLPIAIPVTPVSCNNNGSLQPGSGDWQNGVTVAVPLCKNDAGNVGWLDWTPPGGGTNEIVQEILHPNNPAIQLPSWLYVDQAGNVNSQDVENAINTYDGQVVLVPMFDLTCNSTPDSSQVTVPLYYGCPSGSVGGDGQNQWYRVPAFAAFRLCGGTNVCAIGSTTYTQGAYINGSDGAICGSAWSGAGCLVGQFVNIIRVGPVSASGGGGTSPTKVVGVQLIK